MPNDKNVVSQLRKKHKQIALQKYLPLALEHHHTLVDDDKDALANKLLALIAGSRKFQAFVYSAIR